MLMAGRMHPPFLFCRAKRETGRARSKEKSVGALRCSGPPRDGGRRIGASADLARPSGTLYSSAISPTAVPWRIVRRSSGWSSHGAASLFAAASCPARELPIKASAPTTARAARSEAERAERGAGQMRPCTPPRPLASPRKHAGTISRQPPYSNFARPCRVAAKSVLFFWTVHGPFSFRARPKRKWGVHPAEQAPCGSKDSRGRRTAAFYNSRRSDRPAR